MIELTPLKYDLKKYVEIAYKGDNDLLNKYHVAEYTFEEAVQETLLMIEITSFGIDMKNYAVLKDERIIGYLSCFKHNLYSFGINIKYRTSNTLSEFWDKVREILGNSFITMLYPNNTRAIAWLKRCGMQQVDEVEENAVTLIYHTLK